MDTFARSRTKLHGDRILSRCAGSTKQSRALHREPDVARHECHVKSSMNFVGGNVETGGDRWLASKSLHSLFLDHSPNQLSLPEPPD